MCNCKKQCQRRHRCNGVTCQRGQHISNQCDRRQQNTSGVAPRPPSGSLQPDGGTVVLHHRVGLHPPTQGDTGPRQPQGLHQQILYLTEQVSVAAD